MKTQSILFTFLILICSCSISKKEKNKLDDVKLGISVEEVIEILNIEPTKIHISSEPPLTYRAITTTLEDSTEIAISFKRTFIFNESKFEKVKQLKINGFAWKKKNGKSKIIGEKPFSWISTE